MSGNSWAQPRAGQTLSTNFFASLSPFSLPPFLFFHVVGMDLGVVDLTLSEDDLEDNNPDGIDESPAAERQSSGQSASEDDSDDDEEDEDVEGAPLTRPLSRVTLPNGDSHPGGAPSPYLDHFQDPALAPLPSPSLLPSPTSTSQLSSSSYLAAVAARRALFLPPAPSTPTPRTYRIESIAIIPHATHIHALALPPCSSSVYSGGADGFIRRYSLHSMLNRTGVDNLVMKHGGHPPPPPDVRLPVLMGYWENDDPGAWVDDLTLGGEGAEDKMRWGPKAPTAGGYGAVYSLAVQDEELWGLSGTGVSSFPFRDAF